MNDGQFAVEPGSEGRTPGADGHRQVWLVASQEYRLSVRNRWAAALMVLFALLSVLVSVVGRWGVGATSPDALLVSLAQLATYLVPLAALVYGYDTIVGADANGWLDVLFALPVARWRVVVGAYLGRAVTLAVTTTVGLGIVAVPLQVRPGRVDWLLFATVLLGTVGLGAAFLAVSILISTVAVKKTHALGGALLAWVWFVFLHDLFALGLLATLSLPDAAVSAFILGNPVDIFRVLVLLTADTTGGGLGAVFASSHLSPPVAGTALLGWVLIPVALMGRLVRRRRV